MDQIKKQTEALEAQLKKLESIPEDDTNQFIKELDVYNQMLKNADFSVDAQVASKERKLTISDKILAPRINWVTRQANKINKKLIEHNKR